MVQSRADETFSHDGGVCVARRHDSTDCSLPRPLRPAPRRDVRSAPREFGWRRDPAQGRRRALRVDRGASPRCLVDDRQPGEGAAHARAICWRSASSGSPAAIPMPTTPTGSPTIRSTSCCWGAIRSTAAALASQPTISRFENGRGAQALYQMGHALADTVIARHRRRLAWPRAADHDRSRSHR